MRAPRIRRIDVIGALTMLVGTGLSIVAGKIFGWLIIGVGLGGLIVFHLPASWSGRNSEIVATSPSPALPPPPKPRLKQFGTRPAWVYVPYDSGYFWETDNKQTKALLAIFENEVHVSKTGYVGEVTAKIRFKDDKGNEISELRVQQGRWLKCSSTEVNFPANAQHELIVAIKDHYATNSQIVREAQRKYAELKNAPFSQEKLYVEVSLISRGETLVTGHYVLVSSKSDFSLTQVEE